MAKIEHFGPNRLALSLINQLADLSLKGNTGRHHRHTVYNFMSLLDFSA